MEKNDDNKKLKHIEIDPKDPQQDDPLETSRIHRCPTGCNGCTSVEAAQLSDTVEPVRVGTIKTVRAQ